MIFYCSIAIRFINILVMYELMCSSGGWLYYFYRLFFVPVTIIVLWKKAGNANIEKLLLQEKINVLKDENIELKTKLDEYTTVKKIGIF